MERGSEDPILSRLALFSQTLFEKQLTPNQKNIIKELRGGETLYQTIKTISASTGLSEPTVRRTMQMMRELKLVECGTKQNTGKPLRITEEGTIVLRGYSVTATHSAPDREMGVQFPLTPLSSFFLRRKSSSQSKRKRAGKIVEKENQQVVFPVQNHLTPLAYKEKMNKGERYK